MKLQVVKIGGKTLENPADRKVFLESFAQIEGPKVLVHGGGIRATKLAEQMGLPVQMVNGRRVTDAAMLEVVVMTYGGWLNKGIVADLQAYGTNAIGLAGADANLVKAHKRPVKDVDFGFVGDVDQVNGNALIALINAGMVPVVAPLSHDGNGQLFNTNADTIAAEVALSLTKSFQVQLTYAFDLAGVMEDIHDLNSVIPHINPNNYADLKSSGVIADGMIPKLDNAFDSIDRGVSQVRICHFSALSEEGRGTMIAAQ